MSGGRHACMESLVHQMAAQSVGHMDEARPWTGGGQWFAHLVSATVAFSSGSCANGAPWARTISLVGRWAQIKDERPSFCVARGYAAAVDCTRRPSVLSTWPDRCHSPPPPRGRIFSWTTPPHGDVAGVACATTVTSPWGSPWPLTGARRPVHAVCSNFLRARMLGAGGAGAGVTGEALERANARQDGHGERVRMRSPPRCMRDVSNF